MSNNTCGSCQKNKASLTCGICQSTICKNCTQFLEEGFFSFYKITPEMLCHTAYCPECFNSQVQPEIEKYNELIEKARDINVFEKTQGKETRLIKRIEKPVKITDCPDRDEALLRLAFFAAEKNYNSIIDVDLIPKKVQDGRYQKTIWSGSGVPANVSAHLLVKDRSIWSNPN